MIDCSTRIAIWLIQIIEVAEARNMEKAKKKNYRNEEAKWQNMRFSIQLHE